MNNANVRQAELHKFGALANRWWGEGACRPTTGSHARERPATDGRVGRGTTDGDARSTYGSR